MLKELLKLLLLIVTGAYVVLFMWYALPPLLLFMGDLALGFILFLVALIVVMLIITSYFYGD